jgi:hypothetical protein
MERTASGSGTFTASVFEGWNSGAVSVKRLRLHEDGAMETDIRGTAETRTSATWSSGRVLNEFPSQAKSPLGGCGPLSGDVLNPLSRVGRVC